MFARVTRIEVPPEQLTEEMFVFRRRILAEAQALPGFEGAYDLVDCASGRSIAITFWESEGAMRASERAVKPLGADEPPQRSLPVIERYEVVWSTGAIGRTA